MMLIIDPPVTAFHPVDDIRDWIAKLAFMREWYRDDHEALACIARAERSAAAMLELAAASAPAYSAHVVKKQRHV